MRTENRILMILGWIHAVLLFSGIYLLAAAGMSLTFEASEIYFLGCLWLAVPVVISAVCIWKIRNFFLYAAFAAVVTVGMGAVTGNILTEVLTALIFVIRCYVRIVRGRIRKMMQEIPGDVGAAMDKELWEIPTLLDRPQMAYWSVFIIEYLLLIAMGHGELLFLMFGVLTAEAVITFVYYYFHRLEEFIAVNRKLANLPVATMKKVGNIIFGIAILFLAVCILPSVIYHREPLTRIEWNRTEMDPEIFEMGQGDDGGGMQEYLELLRADAKEAPKWLKAFSNIICITAVAAALTAMAVILFRTIKGAIVSFGQGDEDEIIFLKEDSADDASAIHRNSGIQREKWNSPNRRIRRKYKKTIRKSIKTLPAGWETPRELEALAGLGPEQMKDGRFHDLYEKARYSREGCSREEAEEY